MSEEVKVPTKIGKPERVNFVDTNPVNTGDAGDQLTEEEQANVEKGLNPDGSEKLSAEQQANVDKGLNPDGSKKPEDYTDEEKANVAKGLNPDGSEKTPQFTAAEQANIAKGLNPDGSAKGPLTDDQKLENLAKGLNEDGTPRTEPLTKEQIEALHKRAFPQQVEPTPEEKLKKEQAFEKRMLDWFVEHGGNVEIFMAMKTIASGDLTELSEKELEAELKAAGFTEEEKKLIRAERYYQLEDEAIESLEDENEKALAKKKRDFGTQKLAKKAEHKQKTAVGFFENIKKALTQQDAEAAEEAELAQKVDSHIKAMPRTMNLTLGKTPEGVDIAPLENFPVPEAYFDEIKETLKNADKRNNILLTSDGNVDIAGLSEILLRNKVLEAALNQVYLEGVARNTAEFKKTFPIDDPNALGVGNLQGGSNLGKTKGKLASFGKSQRVDMPATATK